MASLTFQDSLIYSCGKERLAQLLSSGALHLDAKNEKGRSILHVIASNPLGFVGGEKVAKELTKLLIKKGANVNVQDSLGYTPLHLACESCCVPIMRHLLRAKASIWLRTSTGTLPIHILVAFFPKDDKLILDYFRVLDNIMKQMQGGLDAVNNRKDNLLHYLCASKQASEEVLRFILNRDSSFINHANSEGFTPLHCAIRAGRSDMAKTLLEMGADASLNSKEGSCTQLAAQHCKEILPRLQNPALVVGSSSSGSEKRDAMGFITEQLGSLGTRVGDATANLGNATKNLGKETMLSLGLSEIRVFDNYLGKNRNSREMEVINASLRAPNPSPLPPVPTSAPSPLPQLPPTPAPPLSRLGPNNSSGPRINFPTPQRGTGPSSGPPNRPPPPSPGFNTSPRGVNEPSLPPRPHPPERVGHDSRYRSQSAVLALPHTPGHMPRLGSISASGLTKIIEPTQGYSSSGSDRILFDHVESTSSRSSTSDADWGDYDPSEDFEFLCLDDQSPGTLSYQPGAGGRNEEESFYRDAANVFRNSIRVFNAASFTSAITQSGGDALPFKKLEKETAGPSFYATHIHQGTVIHGMLYATTYRLFFQPFEQQLKDQKPRGYKISVPLGAMTKFEMIGEVEPPYCWYRLFRRDFNDVLMAINNSDGLALSRFLEPRVGCKSYRELFAFQHKTNDLVDQGWNVYNVVEEYKRMGIPNASWKFLDNHSYTICNTYPAQLVIPSELSNQDAVEIAKYRTKGRLPVLAWHSTTTKSVIIRCSQPGGGMTNSRSKEDEKYFQLLNNYNADVYIYDARPKLNAYANHLTGGGGENLKYYSGCKRKFLNIGNIHVMRTAFEKLKKALLFQEGTLGSRANASAINAWLEQLSSILAGAHEVVTTMQSSGRTASVVHCSDGWDRTSQIVALAELMLDPYYRTLKGFMVLIEKEWLSFGHKFTDRTGPGGVSSKLKERAPIFHQFIDCVWQLWIQHQKRFEFNEKFLVTVMRHLYSCRFGTFLGDSERERLVVLKANMATYSLWTYVLSNVKAYLNPEYSRLNNEYGSEVISEAKTNKESLQLWSSYYLLSLFTEED